MNEYFPTVVQVIPLDNFHVQVFFDDGNAVAYGHYNTSLPESHKIMISLAYTTSPFQCFFIVYHFFIISAIK